MQNAMRSDHKEQRIREAAYHLWEKDGRPAGQADRHWEMARKIAEDAERQQAAPPAPKANGAPAGKKTSPAKAKPSARR